ncbi:BMC domain-containing protein [Lachnoclostridium sp.]|uniref:BMC domain-containing protein n=1 Tax=Lachnoclostridium sp. TaxID=2028282 RepID=UPI002896D397|nr:BMC domain-containing protein [Lachnoclostridium sp.]
MQALGMIEVIGLPPAIEAADSALKAANVTLLAIAKVDGGILTVEITGDVGAVLAAVDAGAAAAERVGTLRAKHVIPHVDESLIGNVLMKGTKLFQPKNKQVMPSGQGASSGFTNSQADGALNASKALDTSVLSMDSVQKEGNVQTDGMNPREEFTQKKESTPKEDSDLKDNALKEDSSLKDNALKEDSSVKDNVLKEDSSLKENVLREDSSLKDSVLKEDSSFKEDSILKEGSTIKEDYRKDEINSVSQNNNFGRDDVFGESTITSNKEDQQTYTVNDLKKKSNDTLRAILQSKGVELTELHKSAKKQELIQQIMAQQNHS